MASDCFWKTNLIRVHGMEPGNLSTRPKSKRLYYKITWYEKEILK
jgi:hypothetical protein